MIYLAFNNNEVKQYDITVKSFYDSYDLGIVVITQGYHRKCINYIINSD